MDFGTELGTWFRQGQLIELKHQREQREAFKLDTEARRQVVENYYRATNALMNIGTAENIPEELKDLAGSASAATYKIIDYVNKHRNNES